MPINSFINYPLSWKPIREALSEPLSVSLAMQLEQDILSGRLAGGTKLPPQRELADYLDITFPTVTRAYKICRDKGLLYGETGRGTFVAEGKTDLSSTRKEDVYRNGMYIDLAISDMFPEAADEAFKAVEKSIFRKNSLVNLLNRYDPQIILREKTILKQWFSDWGIQTAEDHMVVFQNYSNGIVTALLTAFKENDKIAVSEYAGTEFIALAKLLHLQLVPVPEDENGIQPDLLRKKCASEKIAGIIIQQGNTGISTRTITRARALELALIAEEMDLTVLEFDMQACLEPEEKEPAKDYLVRLIPDRCIFIEEFGLLITCCIVIAPDGIIHDLRMNAGNINVRPPMMELTVLTELYMKGWHRVIGERKRQEVSAYADAFYRHFPQEERIRNEMFFYRWLKVPFELNTKRIEKNFQAKGMNVYRSAHFFTGGKETEHYLLIGFSSAIPLPLFEKGMEELAEAVRGKA